MLAVTDLGAECCLIDKHTLRRLDPEAVIRSSRMKVTSMGSAVSRGQTRIKFGVLNAKGEMMTLEAVFLIIEGMDITCVMGVEFLVAN